MADGTVFFTDAGTVSYLIVLKSFTHDVIFWIISKLNIFDFNERQFQEMNICDKKDWWGRDLKSIISHKIQVAASKRISELQSH